MKKILFATNILFISIIIFWGCAETTSIHSGILKNSDDNTTVQNYSNTSFTGLPFSLVKKMVQGYNNHSYQAFHPQNNENLDSRSILFNLDTLKKFIWYIETTAKKNNVKDMNKLAIRIYYARYPDANDWSNFSELASVPLAYTQLHTAFMIPTYFNGHYNVDFDPKFCNNGNPESIDNLFSKNESALMTALSPLPSQNNMMQNHGSLIPPMTQPEYEGADLMQYSDIHP